MTTVCEILGKDTLNREDIILLLKIIRNQELNQLFEKARHIRNIHCGKAVFIRGLIEISNLCEKNCLYCGIRSGNKNMMRYSIPENEVIDTAKTAWDMGFTSLVIQSGEKKNKSFIDKITRIVSTVADFSHNNMRITLSLGEQHLQTYQMWKDAGADAYLLRIETSNPELYRKIHPETPVHRFDDRINALYYLKETGYQLGTGVMIGLPFQTVDDLADDLIFMKKLDVDMVGMGPYLEHNDTPLFAYRHTLLSHKERLLMTLKMYAVLRILMKDINIASTTALEVLSKDGRFSGIQAGANVIMPDITPEKYVADYILYNKQTCQY